MIGLITLLLVTAAVVDEVTFLIIDARLVLEILRALAVIVGVPAIGRFLVLLFSCVQRYFPRTLRLESTLASRRRSRSSGGPRAA